MEFLLSDCEKNHQYCENFNNCKFVSCGRLVEQKGFFGKGEKLEISDAMKDWMKKNRPKDDRSKKAPKKASINLDKTTDGMYSLFTYSPAELGEEPSKEQPKKSHNKDPKKPGDPKKRPDKRDGRKNRKDSAPGGRD